LFGAFDAQAQQRNLPPVVSPDGGALDAQAQNELFGRDVRRSNSRQDLLGGGGGGSGSSENADDWRRAQLLQLAQTLEQSGGESCIASGSSISPGRLKSIARAGASGASHTASGRNRNEGNARSLSALPPDVLHAGDTGSESATKQGFHPNPLKSASDMDPESMPKELPKMLEKAVVVNSDVAKSSPAVPPTAPGALSKPKMAVVDV
jgi:hypothetical protein